jgi:hypothetical protein
MAMDAMELRLRHIIPVPTDHIMKVAASQLSLSQPARFLAPRFLTLSQSITVNPWFYSSRPHSIIVVGALPECCLRTS